jgi:hypothetical protein
MKIKILKETIKKVDGKYVVYPKKGGKRLGTHDTEEEAKKQLAAIEISKAKNEEQLEEISAMAAGAVAGPSGEKEEISEMFSTSTQKGGLRIKFASADQEHAGHVERSKHQGLRNVMEDDDDTSYVSKSVGKKYVEKGTVFKLSDLADKPANASRVFDILKEIISDYGLDKMKQVVLSDNTSGDRINSMEKDFNYVAGIKDNIVNGDEEAIKKYYQFLINEFMLWISKNPRSSAQMYSGRKSILSKPTKDLAYALTYRYLKDPNNNNPRAMGKRMSKEAEFYKLDKDLDPSLYNLPE